MILKFYLTLLFLALPICGRGVNVTIDDQFGDPTTGQVVQYTPPEAWHLAGQDCDGCAAKPRPISNAYNSTWTDGTFYPKGTGLNGVSGQIISASVPFIGTAVYVQVILTGSATLPDGNSDFTFYIDNVTSGVFQRAPNGDKTYQFNQTVFSMTGLSNSLHTLRIDSGHAGRKSLVLLDSIIYTKEIQDGTSNSSDTSNASSGTQSGSSTNISVIIGPVIGGVVLAGVVLALVFFLRRRRRRQSLRGHVLLDRPHTEVLLPAHPAHPSNIDHDHAVSQIGPFIANLNMQSVHNNSNSSFAASARGVPGPGAATRAGPSGLNTSSHDFASTHNTVVYGRVNESQRVVNTALASPPVYRKVNTSGLTIVSR